MIKGIKKAYFLVLLVNIFASGSLFADEQLFGYTQVSETMPKGTGQIYQWFTQRSGKGSGTYIGRDFRTELEYGLTDRIQNSFYLNLSGHKINNAQSNINSMMHMHHALSNEFPNKNTKVEFNGISNALKFNILSPFIPNKFGNIGFALYVEPSYSTVHKVTGEDMKEYGVETRIIFQKNFLNDRGTFAFNINTEFEKRKMDGSDEWEDELALEFTSGLTYLVKSNWYLGLEARYHSEYPAEDARGGFSHSPNYGRREHWAVFVGPTVHYAGKEWWITATYLPQIVGAVDTEGQHGNKHLGEHEMNEFRVKVAYNF